MKIENLKLIGQGNTAEIFELEDNKIVKIFREGMAAEVVLHEYEQSIFIHTYLKNTPKAYELTQVSGRPAIIYERVCGVDMIKAMLRSVLRINDYAKMLADLHLTIHQEKVGSEKVYQIKQKLLDDISAVKEFSAEQVTILGNYIAELPEGQSICHFDFHPGNIMLRNGEGVIIDWMTACIGDPCADVARTLLLLKYGELANANYFVKKAISLSQRYVAKIYYKEYLKQMKVAEEDVERWILPVAAARLSEWIPDSERKRLLELVTIFIARRCRKSPLQ